MVRLRVYDECLEGRIRVGGGSTRASARTANLSTTGIDGLALGRPCRTGPKLRVPICLLLQGLGQVGGLRGLGLSRSMPQASLNSELERSTARSLDLGPTFAVPLIMLEYTPCKTFISGNA